MSKQLTKVVFVVDAFDLPGAIDLKFVFLDYTTGNKTLNGDT